MIRWMSIGIVSFIILVTGISWFLAPDNLMQCSEVPSNLDGCEQADVIIAVSGGDTTARTQEAIDLYKNGWAPKLIFSGAAQDKSGPSNAAVMKRQAIEQGIPEAAITTEDKSETTKENAEKTRGILASKDIRTAIVVTSRYHMKRTILEFRERAPNVTFRAHPTIADSQWSSWWWVTPHGWYLALTEIVKIIVFYLGGGR